MKVPEDPFVPARQYFPLGPSIPELSPVHSPAVVPFGVRYAVPPAIETAKGNKPTRTVVSVNTPTSTDGRQGKQTITDDVPMGADD